MELTGDSGGKEEVELLHSLSLQEGGTHFWEKTKMALTQVNFAFLSSEQLSKLKEENER